MLYTMEYSDRNPKTSGGKAHTLGHKLTFRLWPLSQILYTMGYSGRLDEKYALFTCAASESQLQSQVLFTMRRSRSRCLRTANHMASEEQRL